MTDELRIHWQLHLADARAHALETSLARQAEPRRAHAARLDASRRALAALDERVAEAVRRRRALEREIAAIEDQERRFDRQLAAVTNQQQYEAVQHQLATARAKRSELETGALESLEIEAEGAAERPALVDALARTEGETTAALAALDAEALAWRAQLDALAATRAAHTARLDAASRSRYERLHHVRGGIAVAELAHGACGACHAAQPPHVVQEARRHDRLLTCDSCGRLLMLAPPDGA